MAGTIIGQGITIEGELTSDEEVVFSEKAFREEVAREMAKIDAQHAGEMKGASTEESAIITISSSASARDDEAASAKVVGPEPLMLHASAPASWHAALASMNPGIKWARTGSTMSSTIASPSSARSPSCSACTSKPSRAACCTVAASGTCPGSTRRASAVFT